MFDSHSPDQLEGTMPVLTCQGCGRFTNTAVAEWFRGDPIRSAPEGEAFACFAARENGKWVRGCGYDNAHEINQRSARKLIGE